MLRVRRHSKEVFGVNHFINTDLTKMLIPTILSKRFQVDCELDLRSERCKENNEHEFEQHAVDTNYYVHQLCSLVNPRWTIYNTIVQMTMHSLSSRFNTMVLFSASVLAAMCVLNFGSGYFLFNSVEPQNTQFQITGFRDFNKSTLYKWQTILFKFNLKLNLKQLHNWNLKQIFLWVEANYVSPQGLNSTSSIVDWIIEPSKTNGSIDHWNMDYKDIWAEYPLRDVYNSLKGQEVTFRVMMEYMPHVGIFFKKELKSLKYRVSEEYAKKR